MKFYNLGDKTLETDFKLDTLTNDSKLNFYLRKVFLLWEENFSFWDKILIKVKFSDSGDSNFLLAGTNFLVFRKCTYICMI